MRDKTSTALGVGHMLETRNSVVSKNDWRDDDGENGYWSHGRWFQR